ncbi:low molecular weight protein-tyrosine-phosphatase [Burkholderia thailandensis]|uniref:protein-tyrosine-phosphatase n=2 Tax=Burkholderia thailandensis TaxID=57975 RepID=A0AAW9D2H5_BURTH|nr:low molecular weight protein-tyrosine-phosphatase [Burkholderia thailandensis]ABC39533.1 low molecular weight protein-tyrosine-phosphatase [Burkholderia thailandensis E264]AHI64090.1 low molecular weight protein-tyrosine-phosphatase ptp [Burkholderia thailandensis H0587]AHI72452.1 low molecular weight protein-tyrosine-phosphatase ptp [Burkholderia thailandensis 2002721723]AHI77773.1 low molecular weight protein-tyrosine-phosphatase ptp [Burkholderia thailandensis E444]AIC88387.1 low molecul
MIDSILVVCEGNLCRSPMAAALFAASLPGRTVTSAGFNALVGLPAAPLAQDVMRERGIDLSAHRAQQLGRAQCATADLILVMDHGQRRLVEERHPLARGKVFRIGEHENFDVHDPYRQPRFVFERSARLLELGVNGWLARLRLV